MISLVQHLKSLAACGLLAFTASSTYAEQYPLLDHEYYSTNAAPYLWRGPLYIQQLQTAEPQIVEIIPVPVPAAPSASIQSNATVNVVGVVKKGLLTPENIRVEIAGTGIDQTRTDENGRFVFRDLPAGQYIIRAEGPVQNYTRSAARVVELDSSLVLVELELQ